MLRRGARRGYRRRDTVDERDGERLAERVAALEFGEFRLSPNRGVDAPVRLTVDEHPRHDDQAVEIDSDARQLAREDKRAKMREILVQLSLRDQRYRFGPRRPPQLFPHLASSRLPPAEQRKERLRGDLVERREPLPGRCPLVERRAQHSTGVRRPVSITRSAQTIAS